MLRGTITLADHGALLRAFDLWSPLFTVLDARSAARGGHSERRRRSGEAFPEIRDQGGWRERSVARQLCYEFAQPIAGVREDRDSVADDERVEVECEDAPQTRA